jgi:hypothetical protein
VGQKLVSKSLSAKIIIAGVLLKVFTTVATYVSWWIKVIADNRVFVKKFFNPYGFEQITEL